MPDMRRFRSAKDAFALLQKLKGRPATDIAVYFAIDLLYRIDGLPVSQRDPRILRMVRTNPQAVKYSLKRLIDDDIFTVTDSYLQTYPQRGRRGV